MDHHVDYIQGLIPEAPGWACEQLAKEMHDMEKRLYQLTIEVSDWKRSCRENYQRAAKAEMAVAYIQDICKKALDHE